MNRGRQGSFSIGGYTVVETLIFLAVSSLIFVSAIVLIGGRQAKAQFQSGVRSFETQLADMANDVATGYYRSTGTSKECSEGGSGPQFSGSDKPLGTNQACVFIGTVVKLGVGGAAGDESYVQFTMAGLRQSGGANATSLAQAKPKVLNNGVAFEPKVIGAGIHVECIAIDSGPCNDQNAAIGFFTTFEGASLSGEGGGAVQADAINYGPSATLTQTAAAAETSINAFNYASASLNRKITICLIGGSNQYALVRLGGDSSSLAVISEIKEGTSCS